MSLRERRMGQLSCLTWFCTVLVLHQTLSVMLLGFPEVLAIHSPTDVSSEWTYHREQFVEMPCICTPWLRQSKSHSRSRSARRAVTYRLGCHHQHASSHAVWGRILVLKRSLPRHLRRTTTSVASIGKQRHRPPHHLRQDHFHYIFQGCQLHLR